MIRKEGFGLTNSDKIRRATEESTPPDMAMVTESHFHNTKSCMVGMSGLIALILGGGEEAYRLLCRVEARIPWTGQHILRFRHVDIVGLDIL